MSRTLPRGVDLGMMTLSANGLSRSADRQIRVVALFAQMQ
jgi:hypothetical protein